MEVRPSGEGRGGGPRPGPFPLVVALLALAAGTALLGRVEVPSGRPASTTSVPEPRAGQAFESWPPFAITWHVTAAEDAVSLIDGILPLDRGDPCGTVGGPECYIRFAWGHWASWSVAVSSDPAVTPGDLRHVVWGRVAYRLEGGVVTEADRDARIVPPTVCAALLRDSRRGFGPTAHRTAPASGAYQGTALVFREGETDVALCAEPWGIPLEFSGDGHRFRTVSISVGEVGPEVSGLSLVGGRAVIPPTRDCGEGEVAFSASPAGRWLADLMLGGYRRAAPAGSGLAVGLPGTGDGLLWVTGEDATLGPEARRRAVSGVLLEEVLSPVVVVSARGESGVRIWATHLIRFGEVPGVVEDAVAELEPLVTELVLASRQTPYRGPLPAGEPALGSPEPLALDPGPLDLPPDTLVDETGPGFVVRDGEARVQVSPLLRLPREDRWLPAPPLPDGSPKLEPLDRQGPVQVLSGGAVLSVDLMDGRLPDLAFRVTASTGRCPWTGMRTQPRW